MWNLFFFFHFLWKDGLSYEAQAGSVCSGNIDFPEQYISERGGKNKKKQNLTATARPGGLRRWQKTIKREEQNNKNPGRLIICKVEHTGVGKSNLNRRHGSIYRPRM